MNNKDIIPTNADGLPHGSWEVYWGNGQLRYKGNWFNFRQHGFWEVYYSDGNLRYKCNYVNGEPHDYVEWYDSNKTFHLR